MTHHKKALSETFEWHGGSNLFLNRKNALYSDTTYSKYKTQKDAKKSLINSLNVKFSELDKQNQLKNNISLLIKTKEKWSNIKSNLISSHFSAEKLFESSAIKIQKCVRGFLSRLKTEQDLLLKRETRTQFVIQETDTISKTCLFHLGDLVENSAKKIQQAIKRYIKRLGLYKLQRLYYLYLEQKSKEASELVRKFISQQVYKAKIQEIVFLKTRETRLVQIKENLAILRLKKYWKKRKLSFKVLLNKILRIKKKKAAQANKEKYSKMLTYSAKLEKPFQRTLTNSVSIDLSGDEDLPEDAEEREKFLEEQEQLKKEKEVAKKVFNEKVLLSKQAYGLKDSNFPVVIPMLQERELSDLAVTSLEVRLYENTSSSSSKKIINLRTRHVTERNTQIYSPPRTWLKKTQGAVSVLPPLIITENCYSKRQSKSINPRKAQEFSVNSHKSKCRRHDQDFQQPFQPNPEKDHFSRRKQFLNKGTLVQMLKVQEKKAVEKGNFWRNSKVKEKYLTGIDNTSFEKKIWKPVKLDKSILESLNSSQLVSSSFKMHLRASTNPSSSLSF